MESKNVIELNGKRYDAVTGTFLGTSTVSQPPNKTRHSQKNVDGVLRAVPKPKPQVPTPEPVAAKPVKPKTTHIAVRAIHSTSNHTVRHKPQPAHTLMRRAVKKPAPGLKKQIHVQAALQHKTPSIISKKTAAQAVEPARLERAQQVPRSTKVMRFHPNAVQAVPVAVVAIPVQEAPQPAPVAAPAPKPSNKPVDMFEQAIANANNFVDTQANKAHFHRKARKHVASMAAGSLALLLLVGFAFYQSSPGLQIKVAGMQAGVTSAGVPNLQAVGYAYNGVKATNGKLVLGFENASGQYNLVQQKTNWSSENMISEVSAIDASGTPNYTTVQAGDNTIYRFDNTSATWVENGTWYQLSGTTTLTDDQVKTFAGSI
jgi:hypothetical protein